MASSPVLGPIGGQAQPFRRAQQVAARRTQQARRKVERTVSVPAIPKLAHPTSAQRGAAQSLVAGSLHRQGITTQAQVNALPAEQRRRVNRAKGYARTSVKYADAARALAAQPSLAEQARALAVASMQARSPAALSRALGLEAMQAYTDARHPLAALGRQSRALGLRSIQNATLAGRADLLGRRGLQGALSRRYWQNLAAEGERLRAQRGDFIAPGHHTHADLQVAGFGPNVDLSNIGHALAGVTTLGRGDAGPRDLTRNALRDVAGLGTAPFIGGYEVAASAVEGLKKRPYLGLLPFGPLVAAATTQRGQSLARGVAQGYAQSVPGELLQGNFAAAGRAARQHPLYAALDLAGVAGAAGRTAGAVARGLGSTTEAAGLRGALARAGSTVRPPIALNEDGGMSLAHRSYSKDSLRKANQVAADSTREPLLDARGNPVFVMDRGRRVPVLKAHPGERDLMNARRVDHFASGSNALERLSREGAQRDVHAIHRGGRVKGRLGRNAREIVSMVAEKTIRPGHWTEDIDKRIARLEAAIANPREAGFRHTGEVKKAREELKALRKARDASPAQQALVARAADQLISVRKGQQAEEFRLKTLDPAEARRAELGTYAVSHMDARHFTVEEHAQLERAAYQQERAARAAVDAAPKGSAERAHALADYRRAREHRISVSGRDPGLVRRHEDIQRQATRAEAAHARAQERVRKLENERNRLTGRQQVQRGPAAARKMQAVRGAPNRAHAVLRHIDSVMEGKHAARGAAAEEARANVAAKLDERLRQAREKEKATRKAARELRRQADSTSRPPASAAVRNADGTFLSNADIERHMRDVSGLDPQQVAHLSHRELGRGAFHKRLDPNTRPRSGGPRRTYHAFERGASGHGHAQVEETVAHSATRIAKAQSIDRFIHDHGLLHPAAGKAARGETLTPAEQSVVGKGGGWTAAEAAEAIDRLSHDTGREYVAVRMYGAAQDRAAIEAIQQMQSPRAFDELGSKLLNDRILDPSTLRGSKSKARNIALVDAAQMNRMVRHLAPAGELERLFQMLNRPFRFSVLAQPKWLTGNFVEPYFVRLPAAGSGFANVYGLGLDIAASRKMIRSMERSGDPAVRAEAQRLKAQQHGGLFIGGRGASNRRKLADSSNRVLRVGAAIRELPVVRQLGDLLQAVPSAYFKGNRALIERWAQEASFGRSVRRDLQEITGSWTQTVLLGRKAMEDVRRGLMGTAAQERFMRAQHEMLGKYEGYSPLARRVIQTVAPFLPWALSAARFVYWTMPAHHTLLTSMLVKTEQLVDQAWRDDHADAPASKFPGLQLDPRNGRGGFTPFARYTPYGLTGPVVNGDLQGVTNEFLPQLEGLIGALEGKDPFGNDLKVKPSAGNPQGKASLGQKALIALNALAESSLGPFPRMIRTLEEHGATPYSNSFLWSPKTKPDTAYGMSGLRRYFDPLRPTYVRAQRGGAHPAWGVSSSSNASGWGVQKKSGAASSGWGVGG